MTIFQYIWNTFNELHCKKGDNMKKCKIAVSALLVLLSLAFTNCAGTGEKKRRLEPRCQEYQQTGIVREPQAAGEK